MNEAGGEVEGTGTGTVDSESEGMFTGAFTQSQVKGLHEGESDPPTARER